MVFTGYSNYFGTFVEGAAVGGVGLIGFRTRVKAVYFFYISDVPYFDDAV